jgi:hypothetical protein
MGNREDGIVNPNHDSLVKGFPRKRFLVKLKIKKETMTEEHPISASSPREHLIFVILPSIISYS